MKQQHSTPTTRRPFLYRPTRLMSRRMLARGLREEVQYGGSLSKLYASLLLQVLTEAEANRGSRGKVSEWSNQPKHG